jgi:hypothetical protein
MAASSHTQTFDQTQQTLGGDVLTALVRRLCGHARAIKNSACTQMGQDMLATALAIEQQLLCGDAHASKQVGDLPAAEAMALPQLGKRFAYEDGERFSSRHDGGAERDAMLTGIDKLRRALADAGFAPR